MRSSMLGAIDQTRLALLIALLAGGVHFAVLQATGPVVQRDTAGYLAAAAGLREHGRYWSVDPARGKLEPHVTRMPLFPAALAGSAHPLDFAMRLNLACSMALAFLASLLGMRLFGTAAGLLAGLLAAVSPAMVFNSVTVLPDTLFTSLIASAAMACALACRTGRLGWCAASGLALALAILTKPAAKYLWPVFAFVAAWSQPRRARAAAAVALLPVLATSVWMARNYWHTGHYRLDCLTGVAMLCSTKELVRAPRDASPRTARAIEIVRGSPSSWDALDRLVAELKVTRMEGDTLLSELAAGTIWPEAGRWLATCARNFVNFFVSPNSVLILAWRAGGLDPAVQTPAMELYRQGRYGLLCVNVSARLFLGVLAFVLVPLAAWSLARDPAHRSTALVFGAAILYFALLGAPVSGYDRYRAAVEPLMFLLVAGGLRAKPPEAANEQ